MRIRVEATFDAATALPGHDRCAGLHGHTYKVEAFVTGQPKDGVLVDFREVRGSLRKVLDRFDHQDLSAQFEYPSCEILSIEICKDLAKAVPGLEMVRVWEGEGKWIELDAKDLASLTA